ncbi:MAG: hypothetical protein WDW38_008738 [Sanguina aurantia]
MAEAQQRWLQQMRSAIRKMTEASAAVAALHLPNPSLHTHLPPLAYLSHDTAQDVPQIANTRATHRIPQHAPPNKPSS